MILYENTKNRGIAISEKFAISPDVYRGIIKGQFFNHVIEYEFLDKSVIERHIISIRFFDWLAKILGKEE